MPECTNCFKFDTTSNTCSVTVGSPGRKCVIALLETRLSPLRGSTVVEIGPGTVTTAKEILEKNGNTWYGVEPQALDYRGVPTVRTHEGTVASLPFENDSIDYVIANQSMEHWYEFGTSFRRGLQEIFRILKPGGTAELNVPIHLHAHSIFVRGDLRKVRTLFPSAYWMDVQFEEWRRDFKPLDPWKGWRKAGIPDREIPDSRSASTWILEILITKRKDGRAPSRIYQAIPWWIDIKTYSHRLLRIDRIKRGLARRFGAQ